MPRSSIPAWGCKPACGVRRRRTRSSGPTAPFVAELVRAALRSSTACLLVIVTGFPNDPMLAIIESPRDAGQRKIRSNRDRLLGLWRTEEAYTVVRANRTFCG